MMNANELINQNELHMAQVLRARLSELGVPRPALKILKGRGVNTLGDLTAMTREELLRIRFLGRANVNAIERLLKSYDLNLRQSKQS